MPGCVECRAFVHFYVVYMLIEDLNELLVLSIGYVTYHKEYQYSKSSFKIT